MQRVNALAPITTKNPKGTIRNAIGQSRLIVNTGNGCYGWKYRIAGPKNAVLWFAFVALTLLSLAVFGVIIRRRQR